MAPRSLENWSPERPASSAYAQAAVAMHASAEARRPRGDDRQDAKWWARLGLNQRPLPCEGSALPLSYAPV